MLLRNAGAILYEGEQGLDTARFNNRILKVLIVAREIRERCGRLLLHTDTHAKIDLAAGKDGLDLDCADNANPYRLPPANRARFEAARPLQIRAVKHLHERIHAVEHIDREAACGPILILLLLLCLLCLPLRLRLRLLLRRLCLLFLRRSDILL